MPTYSYRCTECDNAFDIQQAFTDETLTECPVCGGRLRKVFSPIGVSFTGSGFYRNDSRATPSKDGSAKGGSTEGTSSGSGSSGSDSSGSDSSGSGSSEGGRGTVTLGEGASSKNGPATGGGSGSGDSSSSSSAKKPASKPTAPTPAKSAGDR